MTPRSGAAMIYWAIEADFDWGRSLLGIGWFGWKRPAWCDYRCATFETRSAAREHRKSIDGIRTRVVRVQVVARVVRRVRR